MRALSMLICFALLPACSPLRTTAKVGYGTAKAATKSAWVVGKAGTTIATAPMRIGGGGHQSDAGGGSYRIRGKTYHVLTKSQARRYSETGIASYYTGRKTANGERLNSRAFTAAHKTLPFGTKVRVTNLTNRRSITVRINDRGPFASGRIIDLTKRGADALKFRKQGITRVRVEVR
ncbi:MAG: rare lipoprotein A [Verrucomicrobiales bacterium]|jgi:rare lipoprotein A